MVVCGMLETSFHTRKYNPQFNLQNKTESNEFSLPPFVDTPNKLVSLHYNKLTPQLQFENLRGGGGGHGTWSSITSTQYIYYIKF